MRGSFSTADFSDRLDMPTMPAIGIALFLEWSCLRPGTQPRSFVHKCPRFPSSIPLLLCRQDRTCCGSQWLSRPDLLIRNVPANCRLLYFPPIRRAAQCRQQVA